MVDCLPGAGQVFLKNGERCYGIMDGRTATETGKFACLERYSGYGAKGTECQYYFCTPSPTFVLRDDGVPTSEGRNLRDTSADERQRKIQQQDLFSKSQAAERSRSSESRLPIVGSRSNETSNGTNEFSLFSIAVAKLLAH